MKVLAALAALALLTTAAYAEQVPVANGEEEAPPVFSVIEADARLSFSGRVTRGFQVARDDSLILRVGADRYYRATVWEPCARELRWDDTIAFDTGPVDTLDRFSTVLVSGQRCPIRTFDQIAEPPADATRRN